VTPIYMTDRANLSGWYAFKEPRGKYVIWDGCGKFGMQTGFWCPFTGNIVDCNDGMPAKMPSIPAVGYLHGDEFCVLGFPDAEEVLPLLGQDPDIIMDFIDRPGTQVQASMFDEIMDADRVLEGTNAYYVDWTPLPDAQPWAFHEFRMMGSDALCRHPRSWWSSQRSVHYGANSEPPYSWKGRVRDVIVDEPLGLIDYVTVWANPEKEVKVTPLYEGDDELDCPLWTPKQEITLWSIDEKCEHVIGYK